MVQALFQGLRIRSLNNIDEVHDLKGFLMKSDSNKQANKYLMRQVVIRAIMINKALRDIKGWETFYTGREGGCG